MGRFLSMMLVVGIAAACSAPKTQDGGSGDTSAGGTDGADGSEGGDGSTDGGDGSTDGADGSTDGADGADGSTDGADGGGSEFFGEAPDEALPAPDFFATNRDGGARSRADLLGHPTVIWFYPAAASAG